MADLEILDSETGEKKVCRLDAETGEPALEDVCRRNRFKVPRNCLQQQQELRGRKGRPRRKTQFAFQQQKFQTNVVKELIVCTKEIVLILPTFLIFPGWASIFCLLGEAFMHIWSHKRNRKKKNGNIEYRSPLHLISSQFCCHCRFKRWMEKISEIQDKRTLKRRNIYPNFWRRVR